MLPREPRTLPNRTTRKWRPLAARAATISSASSLEAPYTEIGSTALSVEMRTKRSHAASRAASTMFRVPKTLFFTASTGLASISGTCLCAAVWKTTSAREASA